MAILEQKLILNGSKLKWTALFTNFATTHYSFHTHSFLHPLRDRAMDTTHPYDNYCFVFHRVHMCCRWVVAARTELAQRSPAHPVG